MSLLLQLTNGSTTIDLDSGIANMLEYMPLPGPGDVTETARVWIRDTTLAGVLAAIRSIELLLQQAAHDAERYPSSPVRVRFRPAASGTVYTSPLRCGRVEYARDALVDDVTRLRFELTITWTRAGYWEGDLVELPLTNNQGIRVTGGLEVFNPCAWRQAATLAFVGSTRKITDSGEGLAKFRTGDALLVRGSASNDGVYTITTGGLPGEITVAEPLNDELAGASATLLGPCAHHVEIALADVPGSLPAPVRLEFTPADAGAGALTRDLWVGHSAFSDVASLNTLLEGESAPFTDGTRTADPACSAAQYMAHSWSGTSETRLSSIPLDTALLNAAGGNPFLALARLQTATAYTDLWIRLKIEATAGGTVLWAGTPVLLSTTCVLQELGTVQLPPYLVGAGDLQPVVLSLYAKRYTAGSHTLALDYIQLLPLEGFRRLVALGSGLTHAQTLVDDGVEGHLFVTEAGSKVQSYIGYGDPILLWPLVNQRLYLAQSNPAGASLLARSLIVRAWYRPRLATM